MAEAAPKTVRRNAALNVADGALFTFGLSFASAATVLPVFVERLGGGAVAVGAIPVVWAVGMNVPQVFAAHRAQHAESRKRLVLVTALAQRLPWLLLAVGTAWWLGNATPAAGLTFFFAVYGLAAVAGAVAVPAWFDLVTALTPVGIRGRLFAARAVTGAVLSIVAGVVSVVVLEAFVYPTNFAVLFGLAFAGVMGSYAMLALLRDDVPVRRARRIEPALFLRRLPRLLRRQPALRGLLVADALVVVGGVAGAFFAVDAIARFGLPISAAGQFTAVMAAATVVASPLAGVAADRRGHRGNLALAGWATAAAALVAWLAPTAGVYLVAFALSAAALALRTVSRLPLIAELAPEADRPSYVALSNALTAPFAAVGVAAGWAVERYGTDAVFAGATAAGAASAYWMTTRVREPRHSAPGLR
ncbi:MFS transporter [Rubrivirga sp.]|uniref:MFS transporter n=1 Tax=Rubrivirga sp. TaxID=1885344 RepID=UPI003B52FF17